MPSVFPAPGWSLFSITGEPSGLMSEIQKFPDHPVCYGDYARVRLVGFLFMNCTEPGCPAKLLSLHECCQVPDIRPVSRGDLPESRHCARRGCSAHPVQRYFLIGHSRESITVHRFFSGYAFLCFFGFILRSTNEP
jgi:hypothetical protein